MRCARLRSEKCYGSRPGECGEECGGRHDRARSASVPPGNFARGARGGLTPRELEILQHIVAGKSNKEIAVELNLSANTVAVHRANIMDTLEFTKRRNWWSTPFATAWLRCRDSTGFPVGSLCDWICCGIVSRAYSKRIHVQPHVSPSDVTAAAGIQFRHNNGGYGGKLLPRRWVPVAHFSITMAMAGKTFFSSTDRTGPDISASAPLSGSTGTIATARLRM